MTPITRPSTATKTLSPERGALTQEVIDVGVILNALRALTSAHQFGYRKMPAAAAMELRHDHERMETALDRLREIADALDTAEGGAAVTLISEADEIVSRQIVEHEREDELAFYPRVSKFLADRHGLGAMSRVYLMKYFNREASLPNSREEFRENPLCRDFGNNCWFRAWCSRRPTVRADGSACLRRYPV